MILVDMEVERGDKVTAVVVVVVVVPGFLNPLINVWFPLPGGLGTAGITLYVRGCVPRLALPCRCYLGAVPVVFKSPGTTYCCPMRR